MFRMTHVSILLPMVSSLHDIGISKIYRLFATSWYLSGVCALSSPHFFLKVVCKKGGCISGAYDISFFKDSCLQ